MTSPMNLLIFLTHPEPTRSGYEKYLEPRHPELNITTVATRDEALKLAPRGRHPDGVRAAGAARTSSATRRG